MSSSSKVSPVVLTNDSAVEQ